MSRRAVFSIAAAACVAGPAFAADPYYPKVPAGSPLYQPASVVTGQIEVFGGLITGSGTSASGSGGVIGGTARANIPVFDWWNLQLTIDGIGANGASGATNLTHTDLSGRATLWTRMGGWNLGGSLGFTRQASTTHDITDLMFHAGVPVFDGFYVGAHAGLGFVSDGGSSGTVLRAGVNGRYEFTPNHTLRGDLMYTSFTGIPGASYNVWTAALTGERRFGTFGLTGTLRWDGYSGDASGSTFQALIGGKVYFDQSGSTLDTQWDSIPFQDPRYALHL